MNIYDITPGGAPGWLAYKGSSDGTAVVVESTAATEVQSKTVATCKVDTGKFAIVYVTGSGATGVVRLAICTVSGTTITIGTPIEVSANSTQKGVSVVALSTSKIVVGWRDHGGTDPQGQTISSYTISGTTPTLDATLLINNTQSTSTDPHFSVHLISSTRVFCHYWDGTNKRVVGVTVGSGSLTKDGTSLILKSGAGANLAAVVATAAMAGSFVISSTRILTYYSTATSGNTCCMILSDNDGTALGEAGFGAAIRIDTGLGARNKLHIRSMNPGTDTIFLVGSSDGKFGYMKRTGDIIELHTIGAEVGGLRLGFSYNLGALEATTGGFTAPVIDILSSISPDSASENQMSVRGAFFSTADYGLACLSQGYSGRLSIKAAEESVQARSDILSLSAGLAIVAYPSTSNYINVKAISL